MIENERDFITTILDVLDRLAPVHSAEAENTAADRAALRAAMPKFFPADVPAVPEINPLAQ